jgi:hypothetical protein
LLYLPSMPALGAREHLALRLCVVVLVAAAVVALAGTGVALLLAPALLLTLPLLLGRYPGERALGRFARRPELPRGSRSLARPRTPHLLGTRLAALAAPGAGRAPPSALLI